MIRLYKNQDYAEREITTDLEICHVLNVKKYLKPLEGYGKFKS